MEWQPIETAPRDGRDLLLWANSSNRRPEWGVAVGFFDADAAAWRVPDIQAGGFAVAVVTHWMPLPEAPVPKNATNARASEIPG